MLLPTRLGDTLLGQPLGGLTFRSETVAKPGSALWNW